MTSITELLLSKKFPIAGLEMAIFIWERVRHDGDFRGEVDDAWRAVGPSGIATLPGEVGVHRIVLIRGVCHLHLDQKGAPFAISRGIHVSGVGAIVIRIQRLTLPPGCQV